MLLSSNHNIDTSFITQLEQRNQNYKFMRIDADVTDALKEEVSEEEMKSATGYTDRDYSAPPSAKRIWM